VALFPGLHFALQLVDEVHEEDDVVLSLLRPRRLGGGYQRDDAFAVRREIEVLQRVVPTLVSDHIHALLATKESPFTDPNSKSVLKRRLRPFRPQEPTISARTPGNLTAAQPPGPYGN
jgi:hypothetical protein